MEPNNPKVSVIIPCYNLGAYIDEAVDSVLNQTFQDFEIIIVNDGSTDAFTNTKLAIYNKPKTTVYTTENKGVSAARNFGIAKSRGEYIVVLDADDVLDKLYLEMCLIEFQSDNELVIVYSLTKYIGVKTGLMDSTEYEFKKMLLYDLIFCSAMYKRTDFDKTNGYDNNFKIGAEDWDFWLNLINKDSKVKRINEILFYYRIRNNSRDNSYSLKQRWKFESDIYLRHFPKYFEVFGSPIEILREYEILKQEADKLEFFKQQIYNSLSYRIGNFILSPFKLLKKLFKQ